MTKITKRGILQTGLLFSALLVLLASPASAQAAGTSDTLTAYPVTVEEKVTGDTPDSQNTFVFTLTAVSTGAPLPTNGTELSITGSGSADYTFDLSSARPGDIYEYTLRQQSAGADNYTQDTSEYTVRIYIVRNDSGVLSPETVITGADTKCASCVFTNQYTAPAVTDLTTSSPFTGVTENTGVLLLAAALIAAGAIIVIAGKMKAAGKDVR